MDGKHFVLLQNRFYSFSKRSQSCYMLREKLGISGQTFVLLLAVRTEDCCHQQTQNQRTRLARLLLKGNKINLPAPLVVVRWHFWLTTLTNTPGVTILISQTIKVWGQWYSLLSDSDQKINKIKPITQARVEQSEGSGLSYYQIKRVKALMWTLIYYVHFLWVFLSADLR